MRAAVLNGNGPLDTFVISASPLTRSGLLLPERLPNSTTHGPVDLARVRKAEPVDCCDR